MQRHQPYHQGQGPRIRPNLHRKGWRERTRYRREPSLCSLRFHQSYGRVRWFFEQIGSTRWFVEERLERSIPKINSHYSVFSVGFPSIRYDFDITIVWMRDWLVWTDLANFLVGIPGKDGDWRNGGRTSSEGRMSFMAIICWNSHFTSVITNRRYIPHPTN